MPDIDLQEPLRASRLWRLVPGDRRLETAIRFWSDDDSAGLHAEAIGLLAGHLKFRPRSVIGLPDEKKARYLVSIRNVSEAVASRLLVTYHLAFERPMMSAFLDALGVPHDNGVLTENLTPPEPAKLAQAARTLKTAYPAEDVRLYFLTLLYQDDETWAPLREQIRDEGPRAG